MLEEEVSWTKHEKSLERLSTRRGSQQDCMREEEANEVPCYKRRGRRLRPLNPGDTGPRLLGFAFAFKFKILF